MVVELLETIFSVLNVFRIKDVNWLFTESHMVVAACYPIMIK